MSDTKLRDLERRWKETGTVDDEAAYLLERVRVGDLTRERLELAAYDDRLRRVRVPTKQAGVAAFSAVHAAGAAGTQRAGKSMTPEPGTTGQREEAGWAVLGASGVQAAANAMAGGSYDPVGLSLKVKLLPIMVTWSLAREMVEDRSPGQQA